MMNDDRLLMLLMMTRATQDAQKSDSEAEYSPDDTTRNVGRAQISRQ